MVALYVKLRDQENDYNTYRGTWMYVKIYENSQNSCWDMSFKGKMFNLLVALE